MSDSIGVSLALGVIKSVVCVYDVVTLPVYFLLQKPWETTRASAEPKSKSRSPEDPYSPWMRIGSPPDHNCFKAKTINELVSLTVDSYKVSYPPAYMFPSNLRPHIVSFRATNVSVIANASASRTRRRPTARCSASRTWANTSG